MSESALVVGSFVLNKTEKDGLVNCSFANCIGVKSGRPFCLCSLGSGVCPYYGRRMKFKFHFSGFEVVWICDRLVGLPNLER